MDRLAVTGGSYLHRAAASSKLLGCAILLVGLLLADGFVQLLLLLLPLLALWPCSGLPIGVLLPLACYPAAFSLPFALLRMGELGIQAALFPLRSVTAALVLMLVLASTPYPQLISALSRILPGALANGVLLIYRLFFVMVGSLERLLSNLRLRGVLTWRNLPLSILATLRALGLVFVQTIAVGETMQQVLELRGYQDGLLTSDTSPSVNLLEGGLLCCLALFVLGVILIG
jgi:energy-coupling factor transporter transmembrane protein EcfT